MSEFRKQGREGKIARGETGVVARVAAIAVVYESAESRGSWVVGSLASKGDHDLYVSIFAGPQARERAVEYAKAKYSGHKMRDTQ